MSQKDQIPVYEMTEPFYDNLVLWEQGDVIQWEGVPAPSFIPRNEAAVVKMQEYFKARGEEYVPPLSELPDTMDGRVTVAPFHPGDRRNHPKQGAQAAGFPAVPGSPVSASQGARRVGDTGGAAVPPMAQMPQTQVKAPKNFDRAPK